MSRDCDYLLKWYVRLFLRFRHRALPTGWILYGQNDCCQRRHVRFCKRSLSGQQSLFFPLWKLSGKSNGSWIGDSHWRPTCTLILIWGKIGPKQYARRLGLLRSFLIICKKVYEQDSMRTESFVPLLHSAMQMLSAFIFQLSICQITPLRYLA